MLFCHLRFFHFFNELSQNFYKKTVNFKTTMSILNSTMLLSFMIRKFLALKWQPFFIFFEICIKVCSLFNICKLK